MPIGSEEKEPEHFTRFKSIYDFIKPVIEEHFECTRADEIAGPGNITHDIVKYLKESYVVVADLTGHNPNVYYELGIRHSFSNRTILLSQSSEDISFDVGVQRTIIYDFDTDSGKENLACKLDEYLKALIANPDKIDNPVLEFLSTTGEIAYQTSTQSTATDDFKSRFNKFTLRLRNDWDTSNAKLSVKHVAGCNIMEKSRDAVLDLMGEPVITDNMKLKKLFNDLASEMARFEKYRRTHITYDYDDSADKVFRTLESIEQEVKNAR